MLETAFSNIGRAPGLAHHAQKPAETEQNAKIIGKMDDFDDPCRLLKHPGAHPGDVEAPKVDTRPWDKIISEDSKINRHFKTFLFLKVF